MGWDGVPRARLTSSRDSRPSPRGSRDDETRVGARRRGRRARARRRRRARAVGATVMSTVMSTMSTARDREGGGGWGVGDVRGTTGDARGESGGDDEDEDDTETETETGARRRAGGVRSADSREREGVGGDASARGCK